MMNIKMIVWLTLCLLAMQCKEEPPPKEVNQLDLLPPATTSGRYTFGCLVNGKAWVPETSMKLTAIYQRSVLLLGANLDEVEREQNIRIDVYSDIYENKTYDIFNPDDSLEIEFIWHLTDSACYYEPEHLLNGTLTITNFDRQNYIVSGTFAFATATEGCDSIRVTDGRFDMHYIP